MTKAAALAVLLFAHAAVADDTGYVAGEDIPSVLEIDDCKPNDTTLTHDQLQAQGGEHYTRGEQLYVQGDYKGAVRELVASYCTIPYYTILKDIGQAYERDLDYELAIAYLRRYERSVPDDAKATSACAADPQDDKKNVKSRVAVLMDLKARVQIDTNVPDAHITLTAEGRTVSDGKPGVAMPVLGGKRYTATITRPGYETVTREIRAVIGKPYTAYVPMERQKGKLRVRIEPPDARIYLDENFLGVGNANLSLDAKSYNLRVEAPDRLEKKQTITILPHQENAQNLELDPVPQVGRRQLLLYVTIAGGFVGAAAGELINDQSAGTGTLLGAGLALAGTYYYGDSHVPLGTSSLTITSSLIGGVAGSDVALIFNQETGQGSRFAAAGVLAGAGVGYYVGERTKISAGDAAVVNSGALWGGVAGHLFGITFGSDDVITGGLGLSGLAMGTTAGVLLTHYYTVSRKHAALIDVGGIVGMIAGVAADNLIFGQTQNTDMTGQTQAARERTADFALGGLATGLIVAGVLSRTLDVPQIPGTLSVGSAKGADGKSVATYGITKTF